MIEIEQGSEIQNREVKRLSEKSIETVYVLAFFSGIINVLKIIKKQ